jgi:ribosomal subunit interface protein
VDIIFKGRHTEVPERFRKHATSKLAKVEKLDQRAIRVDVEIMAERNPRQAGRKERVELTVTSRGPAIRAEAAAEDRFAALDLAFAKLEGRLRRALDRRKSRHGAHSAVRLIDLPEADVAADSELAEVSSVGSAAAVNDMPGGGGQETSSDDSAPADPEADGVVQVEMQGDGPLVVREKFHAAVPMGIDQALFEMELVGHDFFLFTDERSSMPSVVYRRRGYQYGVIRLVDHPAGESDASGESASPAASAESAGSAASAAQGKAPQSAGNGQARPAAKLSGR